MKKLWKNIKLFFISLSFGLRGADKLITGSNKETDGSELIGIEQQKEEESVYADLLRGEVTQEVRELRHNMYYAERKSHDFEWNGGGRAVKKNDMFGYSGKVFQTDGYSIRIVQENKEDPGSLSENGIYSHGEKVFLEGEMSQYEDFYKKKRDFTIKIERDFLPSFKIEQYATKLVVKKCGNDTILDLYVPLYRQQFNNVSKLFSKEMEKIYMGNKRSDVVTFNSLSFVSYNAYGSDDLVFYKYSNINFFNIVEFDGNYVLEFTATLENKDDMITEFYDEEAQRKSDAHEARNGATLNIADAIDAKMEREYDVEQAIGLVKELNENENSN